MPISYIHFSLFTANRSRPPVAAHLDCWLLSAKNRTRPNDTDHLQSQQPRMKKPLASVSMGGASIRGYRQRTSDVVLVSEKVSVLVYTAQAIVKARCVAEDQAQRRLI